MAGQWRGEHDGKYINWLEIKTVRLTLQHNFKRWKGKTLRFLIENSIKIAYIKNKGELTYKR